MTTQKDIQVLAESLKRNGLAASDADAIRMAEKMLGVSKHPEQKFREAEQGRVRPAEPKKEEARIEKPVRLEEIEPVQKEARFSNQPMARPKEAEEEVHGFKEIPVEAKEERPTLTEEEKKKVDLSKWFYYGNK